MIIAETERLIIRTWSLKDLNDFYEIYGNPVIWKYIGKQFINSIDDALRSLNRTMEYQDREGVSQWALELKESGKVIGACGFTFYNEKHILEIAYHLNQLYWHNGYIDEAARAVIKYGFEQSRASKIVALIDKDNLLSSRVAEKLNFKNRGLIELDGEEVILFELLSR